MRFSALFTAILAVMLCALSLPSWAVDRRIEVPKAGGEVFIRIPATDAVMARVLSSGTAESIAVPTGAYYVVFAANTDFCASYTGTAAYPAVDVTDGSACDYAPTQRFLDSTVTSISVVSSAGGTVWATFYKP